MAIQLIPQCTCHLKDKVIIHSDISIHAIETKSRETTSCRTWLAGEECEQDAAFTAKASFTEARSFCLLNRVFHACNYVYSVFQACNLDVKCTPGVQIIHIMCVFQTCKLHIKYVPSCNLHIKCVPGVQFLPMWLRCWRLRPDRLLQNVQNHRQAKQRQHVPSSRRQACRLRWAVRGGIAVCKFCFLIASVFQINTTRKATPSSSACQPRRERKLLFFLQRTFPKRATKTNAKLTLSRFIRK